MEPLLQAGFAIQIHTLLAVVGFVVGCVQLLLPKGTSLHRVLGWIWVVALAIVSVSSFWIQELMPVGPFWGFSPIHLLSVFVLYNLWAGVRAARSADVARHKRHMVMTFIGGILIAGAFTFVPGRLLHEVFMQ